jgi:hypothetical protein
MASTVSDRLKLVSSRRNNEASYSPTDEFGQMAQTTSSKDMETRNRKRLPKHIEDFKRDYEQLNASRINLPVLSQLSPRTKRKIAQLPPPNKDEIAEIVKIQNELREVNTSNAYLKITEISDLNLAKMHRNKQDDNNKHDIDLEIFNSKYKRQMPSADNPIVLEKQSTAFLDRLEKDRQRQQQMVQVYICIYLYTYVFLYIYRYTYTYVYIPDSTTMPCWPLSTTTTTMTIVLELR